METKTIVVFRVFRDGGDVVALFPELESHGLCDSYQRVGQHSLASYRGCVSISRPATPKEYAPLKRELERIGYLLDVRKKKGARR